MCEHHLYIEKRALAGKCSPFLTNVHVMVKTLQHNFLLHCYQWQTKIYKRRHVDQRISDVCTIMPCLNITYILSNAPLLGNVGSSLVTDVHVMVKILQQYWSNFLLHWYQWQTNMC
jgi:hypothetical protein